MTAVGWASVIIAVISFGLAGLWRRRRYRRPPSGPELGESLERARAKQAQLLGWSPQSTGGSPLQGSARFDRVGNDADTRSMDPSGETLPER